MPKSIPAETLLIEGPDALAFAHAQFSSDTRALTVGSWQFSAWLNAQGRVRALFHLARLDEQRLLLLLRGGEAAAMGDALRRYVFRSKLTIAGSPWPVLSAAAALPLHEVRAGTDGITLGCDTHGLRLTAEGEGDSAWRHAELQLGWPWLPDRALDDLLPPALSLHRLQAVAIDKGCYPGQEIVARLHWRGGRKQCLCSVQLARHATPGDTLRLDGRTVGVLLDVIAHDERIEALAVLSDDIASADANGTSWQFDDGLSLHIHHQWES
ncbi:MAG: folate-binding protein YgfZ [Rhodanobacter sp.]